MKIAMLFSGYGSQFVGMGKELYDESRIVQEFFEEASVCLPINFVKLCFASSDAELSKPVHAYAALFLIGVAIYELLKKENIHPDVLAGALGGEYTALYAAGSISFPDGLYLLNKLASLYQELLSSKEYGAVRITNVTAKKLIALCKSITHDDSNAEIAIYEGLHEFYVTGNAQGIEQIRYKGREVGATIKNAPIEIGLHSTIMQPVASGLKMYLEKVDFDDAQLPIISPVDAKILQKSKKIRDFVVDSVMEPIRWDKVIKTLESYDLILQVGPSHSINSHIATLYPDKKHITVSKLSDIQNLKEFLASSTAQNDME